MHERESSDSIPWMTYRLAFGIHRRLQNTGSPSSVTEQNSVFQRSIRSKSVLRGMDGQVLIN